ncbi:MAG: TetR/AcrR family transcriptional regulator [Alphaproteobacteria bacterium]|nr:TetR/AcrR family transcriptional regulator [Alphaproteobacteria bacterium]MDX5416197.1 TetR/AcrR family transcriptional regulator [Alphaproteobacteria bacterium]MDX5493528.1 TetR/AcrR family transcriptional regulator [Alphaproteobacteria bacterium]
MSTARNSAAAQRAAGQDKREVITTAALDLFRHYGYRRTSMEDIARAASVAKGTLYLYFESKDQLFEAICRSLAEQVSENLAEVDARDLPLEEKLLALMEAKFGFVYSLILSSPHAAELIESSHQLESAPFENAAAEFHDAVLRLVRKGVKSGELDPKPAGLSEKEAAETLISAVMGAEKAPDEDSFRKQLRATVRLTLRGLRP